MVQKVFGDKADMIKKNISPLVSQNRFDILYGENYELWRISDRGSKTEYYVASHLEGSTIKISMYLRRIQQNLFDEFIPFLFKVYHLAEKIELLQTLNEIKTQHTSEYVNIKLPSTVSELSNIYKEKTDDILNSENELKKQSHDINFSHWFIKDAPVKILRKYFEMTIGTTVRRDMLPIDEIWTVEIDNEIAAIILTSKVIDNSITIEKIKYDWRFYKYNISDILTFEMLKILIARKINSVFFSNKIANSGYVFKNDVDQYSADVYADLTTSEQGYIGTDRVANQPSEGIVEKIAPYLSGDVFADIGCGDGYVLERVHDRFKKNIGIEYDTKAAENARTNCPYAEIYNIDVNDISAHLIDEINTFYLYNPFVGNTLNQITPLA